MAEQDDLDAHPGRPRGRDEVDPDLMVLPRPRARIGWLLAVSVLIFCGYFMWRLRADLAFSRADDEPRRLAGVAEAASADPESFVAIDAMPDRAFLLRVFASEASDGHRLAPVLGSRDRLWIMFEGHHWDAAAAYDEVYRGRVKRLGDLPFYDDLVAHLETMPAVPRGVEVSEAQTAHESKAAEVKDIGGDVIKLAPTTPLTISERVKGQVNVTAFRTDTQPNEAAWRAALEAGGIISPGAELVSSSKDTWTFRVGSPEGADSVAARLVAAKLLAARAEPFDRTHRTTWGQVAALAVPWDSIIAIAVETRRTAPADARVIVTTEHPGDYWYLIPVYLLFAAFALLFAWALVRTLRREKNGAPAATVKGAPTT
jgi:hypothetical protein